MNLDEVPVGQHSELHIPEHAPEQAEGAQEGTLLEKIGSKNSKVRMDAFVEMKMLMKEIDSTECIREHYINFPKYIADSHPGVQERVLEALETIFEQQPPHPDTLLEKIQASLIEKGTTSPKASVKTKSFDLLSKIMDIPGNKLLEMLIQYIGNLGEAQKVHMGTLQLLRHLLAIHGNEKVPVHKFISPVSSLMSSKHPGVRAEAMNYFKEAYKWSKDDVLPSVSKLKGTQQEELKKHMCDTSKTEPLHSQQEEKKISEVLGSSEIPLSPQKYDEHWGTKLLETKKWTEKRDELEKYIKYIETTNDPLIDLSITFKILLNDPNITVVNLALKIIGIIAEKQRHKFYKSSKRLIESVIQKCKDKKAVAEAEKCLDSLTKTFALEDIASWMESLKQFLNDLIPQVRLHACRWLERCILKNIVQEYPSTISYVKKLIPSIKKLTNDGSKEMRDTAISCLNFMQEIIPSEQNVEVSPAKPSKNQKCSATTPVQISEEKKIISPAAVGEDTEFENTSLEEGSLIINPTIPPAILEILSKGGNQIQGLQELCTFIEKNHSVIEPIIDVLVVWLKSLFQDQLSNPAIANELLNVFCRIASDFTTSKSFANETLSIFLNHYGDFKSASRIETNILNLVLYISDSIKPELVIELIIQKGYEDLRNTLIIKLIFHIISRIVEEYDITLIPLKSIIDFALYCISNSTAPVIKSSASSFIGVVYTYCGEEVKKHLNHKDPSYKSIEAELMKLKPKRKKLMNRHLKGDCLKEMEQNTNSNIDTPCANIASRITAKILSDITDVSMTKRRNAKEEIEKILSSVNNRIRPNGLNPLMLALKTRLSEPCKKLAKEFITLLGNIAYSLGEEFKQFSKIFIQSLLLNLGDKDPAIRAESLSVINIISEVCGAEAIIQIAPIILEKDNSEIRSSLINWILEHKEIIQGLSESHLFVQPLISAVQDRNMDIRERAEELMSLLISIIGLPPFQIAIQDLKPTVKNTLLTILEKYGLPPQKREKEDSIKVNKEFNRHDSLPERLSLRPALIREETKKNSTRFTPKRQSIPSSLTSSQKRLNSSQTHNIPLDFNSTMPIKKSFKPKSANKTNTVPSRKQKIIKSSKSSQEIKQPVSSFLSQTLNLKKAKKSPNKSMISSGSIARGLNVEKIIIAFLGNKDKRAEQEKNTRWPVNEVRADYIEKLKKTLQPLLHSDFWSCMFAPLLSKNVNVLTSLTEACKTELEGIIDLLDLFFKWLTTKMVDQSNSALTKAILEFLECLLEQLINKNYQLQDFEASAILPMLCEKSCITSAPFKKKISELILKFCAIYPPQKVTSFLISSIDSRSPKVRLECLGILRQLIVTHSGQILLIKDLKILAKLLKATSSTETLMKNLAIDVILEVYKFRKEGIWTLLGPLPEKNRDLLQRKFSTLKEEDFYVEEDCNKTMDVHHSGMEEKIIHYSVSDKRLSNKHENLPKMRNPEPSIGSLEESMDSFYFNTLDARDKESLQILADENILKLSPSKEEKKDIPVLRPPTKDLQNIFSLLKNEDISKRVDAIVLLNEKVLHSEQELSEYAENLIEVFSETLKEIFDKQNEIDIPIRFAKYLSTIILKVCSIQNVMQNLSERIIYNFAEQLLLKLVYKGLDKLGENQEGDHVVRTLNSIMLKVLENCPPTYTLIVLIKLYGDYKGVDETLPEQKLPGLVVKSILKMTKIMEALLPKLDVGLLLLTMHEYLVKFPPVDPPLNENDAIGTRVIKTIVHDLVKGLKGKIWVSYEKIQAHEHPDTHIKKWIEIILGDPVAYLSVPKSASSDTSKEELKTIFLKLNSQATFNEAIQDLSTYTRKHTNVDLNLYLGACSKGFREYILSSLERFNSSSIPVLVSAPAKCPPEPKKYPRQVKQPKPNTSALRRSSGSSSGSMKRIHIFNSANTKK